MRANFEMTLFFLHLKNMAFPKADLNQQNFFFQFSLIGNILLGTNLLYKSVKI